jgi:nitrogen regulatory protein PII
MQTHPRKKLEILVEAPILKRVEEILDACGVHVFSVFDGREGRGLSGRWTDESVADALDQRLVWAVCSDEAATKVVERLAALFQRYPGVVVVSDVAVLRAERF